MLLSLLDGNIEIHFEFQMSETVVVTVSSSQDMPMVNEGRRSPNTSSRTTGVDPNWY